MLPQWDSIGIHWNPLTHADGAMLYGVGYQTDQGGPGRVGGGLRSVHNQKAPCAVCRAAGATYTQTGRGDCPEGSRQDRGRGCKRINR